MDAYILLPQRDRVCSLVCKVVMIDVVHLTNLYGKVPTYSMYVHVRGSITGSIAWNLGPISSI